MERYEDVWKEPAGYDFLCGAFAAEVRDLFKAANDVMYHYMNVMCDKRYKVLHVHGNIDAILNIAANNNHVVDILTY